VLNAIMLGVEIDVSAALGQNDVPPAFGASASASGLLFGGVIFQKRRIFVG